MVKTATPCVCWRVGVAVSFLLECAGLKAGGRAVGPVLNAVMVQQLAVCDREQVRASRTKGLQRNPAGDRL